MMRLLYISAFLLLLSPQAPAQTGPDSGTPAAVRSVEPQKWDKAAGDLDYSKDRPKPPKKEKKREEESYGGNGSDMGAWTAATAGLGKILMILAIVLLAALIGYGVYRMLQQPRNRRIDRDGVQITLDNLEDHLHETDLERFLREALAARDFPLAIRLYYLQIIKSLSTRNYIRWSREKTNREYLQEMRQHTLYEPFRGATRTFERVWYGNAPLDEQGFRHLEPELKGLVERIG